MKENDIVADILARAEKAVREFIARPEFLQILQQAAQSGGGFEQRVADTLAAQIKAQETPVRKYWGGSDDYVPKRGDAYIETKKRALDEARRTGKVAEAAKAHGVGRATLYRALMTRGK